MKVLIVSDTHGRDENLERIIRKERPIDLLIHLGDMDGSESYIRSIAGCRCEMVAGNNDFFSKLPRELEIKIGKYNVLMAHGHYYYVTVGHENIKTEGISRNKDIVMFGHTHRPLLDISDEIVVLNPGSLSYPRQEDMRPSYIVMTLDSDEKPCFEMKKL